MVEQRYTCSLGRTSYHRRGMWLKEVVTPWEAYTEIYSLAGLVAPWATMDLQSSLFPKNCTLQKRPIREQFMKNCSLWKWFTLEKFTDDCPPWEGCLAGAGDDCEEEWEVKTTCHELTTPPIPNPLHCWGEGGRESGIKLAHRESKSGGKMFLRFILITLFWIDWQQIQLISLRQFCFVHGSNWWVLLKDRSW